MHLSLKGSLDRQPLTDRLGDRLLAEYGGAAAAYSLRALNGNGESVVRVRRASDNSEQDFTALQVSSGDMVNWVNAQIVPPLDIRELDANGERTGALVEAAAAYSLRNLSASYTGNVVDVRRSSDDAEESFTAEEVSDGTLVAWVGASNDGFVTQWYDQSGNANHATQGTPASQPKIVAGGSLVSGGLDFDAVNDYLSLSTPFYISTDFSIFGTLVSSDFSNGGRIFHDSGNDNVRVRNASYDFRYRSNGVNYDFGSGTSFINNNQSLFSFLNESDEHSLFVNGALKGQNTISSQIRISSISDQSEGISLGGAISELIFYASDQSSNRTAIEANIGETYGIDLPSGVDTGYDEVDGFVETWYDQSGNGNDATQATIASQPKIVDAGVLVSGGLDFDGVDDFFNAVGLDSAFRNVSNAFLFSVSSHDSAASGTECLIYGQAGANTGISRVFVGSVGSNDVAAGRRLDTDSFVQSATAKTSGAKIRSANFDWSGGNVQLFENGTGATATAFSSGAGSTSDTINSPFTIGRLGAASSYWNGTADEIILYLSDESANREGIETNINDHYNIY